MDSLKSLVTAGWFGKLLPFSVIFLFWILGFVLKRVVLKLLGKIAIKTKWKGDEIVICAVRGWLIPWSVMLGISLAAEMWNLSERALNVIDKGLLSVAILSVSFVAARICVELFRSHAETIEKVLPATSLTQNIIRITILTLGTLILLNGLGISITPIITGLGIGGLAVALALQDTLSNLFAGIHLTAAKQIKIGDYIRLESGEEGYVADIGWRNVTLKMISNNMILVPNSKLAQSIITNYHFADRKIRLSIPISVSYESDPEKVERVLIDEVKKAAPEVKGLLTDDEPFVRFMPGFGDFSLDFTLFCQVKDFTDMYLVEHELRKRIFKRFRKEGIEIPFPIQTIYMRS